MSGSCFVFALLPLLSLWRSSSSSPLLLSRSCFFSRYQSSQQHPEAQYEMPYHNMGHYTDGPRDEPVMAELSVHREPTVYQEPFYQNCPPAPNHYQEPVYQQNIREQQHHPAHLHHPQHQHAVQEQSVQHLPQPTAPPQGIIFTTTTQSIYDWYLILGVTWQIVDCQWFHWKHWKQYHKM